MNKKYFLPSAVVLLLMVGAVVLIGAGKSGSESSSYQTTGGSGVEGVQPAANISVATSSAVGSYTLADVAKHADQNSCYTAINGSVYDVTSFISEHPGGASRILAICGIDGSSAFNAKHGGQARPEGTLVNFKIGTLTK